MKEKTSEIMKAGEGLTGGQCPKKLYQIMLLQVKEVIFNSWNKLIISCNKIKMKEKTSDERQNLRVQTISSYIISCDKFVILGNRWFNLDLI